MFDWRKHGTLWKPRVQCVPVRICFETHVVRPVSLEIHTRRWFLVLHVPEAVRAYVRQLESSAWDQRAQQDGRGSVRTCLDERGDLPVKLVYQGNTCRVPCYDDQGVRVAWESLAANTKVTVDIECIGFDGKRETPMLMWNLSGGRAHVRTCTFDPER